jgi:hypothetical protein
MSNPIIKWHNPKKSLPENDLLILIVAGPKKGRIKNRTYKSRVYAGTFNTFDVGTSHLWNVEGAGMIITQREGKANPHEDWKIIAWAYLPDYEPGSPHSPINPKLTFVD